jgi:hypothetical protein
MSLNWSIQDDANGSMRWQMDLNKVIGETYQQMCELEEKVQLRVVADFLRSRGWTVSPPLDLNDQITDGIYLD